MTTDLGTGVLDAAENRIGGRLAELYASDAQFCAAQPRQEITAAVQRPGMRLVQMVATVMEGYAARPALGQRAWELVRDSAGRTTCQLLPRFDTITYGQLWARAGATASAWRHGDNAVSPGDFVCILGFPSSDYVALDFASLKLGAVSVPLQTTAPVPVLASIIDETQPAALCASIESLIDAVDAVLAADFVPPQLVVFDYLADDDDQRDLFDDAHRRLAEAESPVALRRLCEVLEVGATLPDVQDHIDENDDNPLVSLLYTSGSTGTPKGAMYTERMVAMPWLQAVPLPSLSLNFLPLSHMTGRAYLFGTLASGGTGYFTAKSDMSTLFEDLALVRPTALCLVPRICEMIAHRYRGEVHRRRVEGADHAAIEEQVTDDLRRRLLGGRYLWATCGTAPLSAEMTTFMQQLLDFPLINGYGSTEAGGVLMDGVVRRPPVIDYKLVDVPELGYFLTDKPHPRGELLVKTEHMMPGYYKRPEITAEMFDDEGFYRTGDIMAETGPDRLAYVDRRNSVLKLSQGEFVAVSQLEAAYSTSPLIHQIYLYGSSEQSFLLAVVVPDPDAVADMEADLKALLSEALQQTAKDAGLQPYEIPRDFIIDSDPFTEDNKLLTGVGKPARPALKARYEEALQQRYIDIAEQQASELSELRTGSGQRPVLQTVNRAVQATLGLPTADLSPDTHFLDLGGDSLSALSLATLLEELFEVDVPVGVVISPTTDVQRLAELIEAQRDVGSQRPTAASVHGRGVDQVHASEFTLDKFIDETTLANAPSLPRPTGVVNTVLLTGANGYLGRFLCLQWLQQLAQTGGTLICIARGNSPEEARQRIAEAFTSDDALLAQFNELAEEHLKVLAGDIGEANLGLDQDTWNWLADTVDVIVHPAALVNHMLPYHQLFGPNVVGTAELIRLAMTTRLKPFTYISTVGAAFSDDGVPIPEQADVREASPSRAIQDFYANGYSISKWAGEVMARHAHDLCGLPVAVFRCDMILAHSRYAGQLNVPDMFTRLVLSLIATGVAPRSFYRTDDSGQRPRAHYDGLPVDFIAEAITELGGRVTTGFHTYNVVNPHDDGISQDTFIDWLIEDGYPIQHIDDFDDWLARFETALRALPENKRQHSVLSIIDAFRFQGEAEPGSAIPAEVFRAAVREARIGPDHDIPHLTQGLIEKYASDLHHLALL